MLIVDCTKGIQAQTISNFYKAYDAGLKIIPIINKIDTVAADVPSTLQQMKEQFDFEEHEIIKISAKEGLNCDLVLEAIVE